MVHRQAIANPDQMIILNQLNDAVHQMGFNADPTERATY